MYTMQIIAQMGVQFAANLFKEDKYIGGIGNDANGVYVNLKEN